MSTDRPPLPSIPFSHLVVYFPRIVSCFVPPVLVLSPACFTMLMYANTEMIHGTTPNPTNKKLTIHRAAAAAVVVVAADEDGAG
jgi:hypothetical protein